MSDIEDRPTKLRKLELTVDSGEVTKESFAGSETSSANNDVEIIIQDASGEAITQPALSKSQLKKIRKSALWEAGRGERRVRRREKVKAKKALKAEARIGEVANDKVPVARKTRQPIHPSRVPIAIVLDCDFEKYMTEKELVSLGAQITRCYSENRGTRHQPHLVITSWNGKLKDRFENILDKTHERWKGVVFEENTFDKHRLHRILTQAPRKHSGRIPDDPNQPSGTKNEEPNLMSEMVYLTSDSPNTLESLDDLTSYIIGGIVDKNRHKGLCYQKACELGIPTAKLPIGEYMTMQSRSVLAVNHVVEIMLKWMETRDWGEAFLSVIPKRKEAKLKLKPQADHDTGVDIDKDKVDSENDGDEQDSKITEAGEDLITSIMKEGGLETAKEAGGLDAPEEDNHDEGERKGKVAGLTNGSNSTS